MAELNLVHGKGSVRQWDRPGTHYHATLGMGDSTTTSALALLLMKQLVSHG